MAAFYNSLVFSRNGLVDVAFLIQFLLDVIFIE